MDHETETYVHKTYLTKCQFYFSANIGEETKEEHVIEITDIHSMLVIEESCIIFLSSNENKIVEFNPDVQEMADLDKPVQLTRTRRHRKTYFLVTCRGNSSIIIMLMITCSGMALVLA